jgi:hypothetical protein
MAERPCVVNCGRTCTNDALSVALCVMCMGRWISSPQRATAPFRKMVTSPVFEQWLKSQMKHTVPAAPTHGQQIRGALPPLYELGHCRLTSLVFRLPKRHVEALKELAKVTRVRQSVWLREAIADLLLKYGDELDARGDINER